LWIICWHYHLTYISSCSVLKLNQHLFEVNCAVYDNCLLSMLHLLRCFYKTQKFPVVFEGHLILSPPLTIAQFLSKM
jgi:hypothetical protein